MLIAVAILSSLFPTPTAAAMHVQPIDRVLISLEALALKLKEAYAEEYREVSLQSYEKGKMALMQEHGGYTELPKVLQDLMGMVLEAREGSREKYEGVSRVKRLPGSTCFDGCE
ncbi:hypothetical protein BDQ17DRAFT_1431241 [Cyathus striatus]|nr:hypothetical protein BDQ17DRAFT_1431241 [Cyathus striatus]